MSEESKKVTLSNFLLIGTIVTILILAIFFVLTNFYNDYYRPTREKSDIQMAQNFERAITNYIRDSKDYDLTFGEDIKPDVETVVVKMQQTVMIHGQAYGPYIGVKGKIKSLSDFLNWTPKYKGENRGLEIVVNKAQQKVVVKPSKIGNKLVFE